MGRRCRQFRGRIRIDEEAKQQTMIDKKVSATLTDFCRPTKHSAATWRPALIGTMMARAARTGRAAGS